MQAVYSSIADGVIASTFSEDSAMTMSIRLMLVVALLAGGAAASSSREQPAVGKPFGALVLPTVDGSQVVDLASFHGRKVLLIEFASW
ncbi:MAG: hypothetical protein ACI9EF_002258 [Pseudohongiellaceae bacterium]